MVPFSLIIICRTESCRRRRRRSAGTGQNHHGRFGSSPRSITTRRREEQAGRFQSFGLQRRPAAAGLDPSSSGSVRSAAEYSDFSGRFWSQLLLWDICRPPPQLSLPLLQQNKKADFLLRRQRSFVSKSPHCRGNATLIPGLVPPPNRSVM